MPNLPLVKVAIVDYGSDEPAMARYRKEGEERAMRLGNRGPLRFDCDSDLDSAILAAYSRCGFYVFEGLLREEELTDIERDIAEMLARAPVTKGAPIDSQGRPALSADYKASNLSWVKPLSDPLGGTSFANGRHPVKMIEPTPPEGAPEYVMQLVLGLLQFIRGLMRKSATGAIPQTTTKQRALANLFHALICARTRAVRVGRERGSRRPRRHATRERDDCARGNPHHHSQTDACHFPFPCRLQSARHRSACAHPKIITREPAAQAPVPSLPEPKSPRALRGAKGQRLEPQQRESSIN
jgi:hypothetical protein